MVSEVRAARRVWRAVLLAGVLVGVAALCRYGHAILYTYGCKLTFTQVRASKEKKDGKEYMDPDITKGDARALKIQYKKGYKSYTLLSKETRSAGFNQPLVFNLANGQTMTVKFESHRQAWINMKLEVGHDIKLMRVSSGRRGVIGLQFEKESQDVLAIILRPTLLQATRK